MAKAVSLVLADHHVLFAEGLGMLLDAEDDLAVVGVAHHSGQAVELAAAHRPVVLVLDAHLPGGDLVGTLAAAKAASPTTRLLVLSGDAHAETTAAVLASWADGYLAKDGSSRQVRIAIRKLAAGNQAVVVAADPPPGRNPMAVLRMRTLTPRERALLELLVVGWSGSADRAGVAPLVPDGPEPHPEPAAQARRALPAGGGLVRRPARGRASPRHDRLGTPQCLAGQ